jgi:hypothetical protein
VSQPFNPYAPPQQGYAPAPAPYGAPPPGWGPPQFQIVGTDLVAMSNAQLPEVCLKCGAQQGLLRKRRNFTWSPQWTYFLLIVSVLIGAIVIAIMQKRATLDVPLCAQCKSRWTMATVMMVLAVLGIFIALPLVGVIAASDVLPRDAAVPITLFILFAWLIGVVVVSRVFVRGRTLWPRRIENGYVTLAGVNANALAILAQSSAAPPPNAYGGGFSGQYGR